MKVILLEDVKALGKKEIFLNSIVMILGKRLKDTIQGYLPYLKIFQDIYPHAKKGLFYLNQENLIVVLTGMMSLYFGQTIL